MKALLALAFLGGSLAGAQAPPSATALLEEAKAKAATGNRAIFLVFGSSW